MAVEDVAAAVAIQVAASAEWASQAGEEYEPPTPERLHRQRAALERFTRTDPGGCWLAEAPEGPVGFAVAMRRGRLWGLATLFVHPEAQGRGVGRALTEQAMTYGAGADVWVVLSSRDPRAARRYAALGLALHPSVSLAGTVDRTALPGDVAGRDGTVADLDLVTAVDRRLRDGSSRVEDVASMLEHGAPARLHVIDRCGHRGWLVTGQAGRPVMLGADDVATAQSLLVRALVHSEPGEDVAVDFVTAEQNWAVEPCLTAGLTVTACGPVFLSGWQRPPSAWLPSGLYLRISDSYGAARVNSSSTFSLEPSPGKSGIVDRQYGPTDPHRLPGLPVLRCKGPRAEEFAPEYLETRLV